MENISKKLYQILEESCDSCESKLIALSGGLDSSILAHFFKKRNPEGIAVISEDFVSTDLTYCQTISKETKIPLTIYNATTSTILEAVESTIKILKNFNDIEIRNNVVMYLALKWAKENDKKSIITGDGADELFAGYNFLVNKPEEELEAEIKRVCTVMHFPTVGLTNLFESIINEEKYVGKKLTVEKEDQVIIRSRESMYYYEIFKKLYGSPVENDAEVKCPYCKHEVNNSKFCRMCGAFPI